MKHEHSSCVYLKQCSGYPAPETGARESGSAMNHANPSGNGVPDYYPEVDQFITMLRHPFDPRVLTCFNVHRETS